MIRRDALASPNGNVRVGIPPGLSQRQLVGGAALHQPPPQTQRRKRSHEVIDINLNINVNVGTKSESNTRETITTQRSQPTIVQPTYQVRQPPPQQFVMARRPPISANFRPTNHVTALPQQMRVLPPRPNTIRTVQPSYPPPATIITNVAVQPKKQEEPVITGAQPTIVIQEAVEDSIPMVTSYPPPIHEPRHQINEVGFYVPSSVIEDDDIIVCVICKEHYRIRDKQRHSNKHRKSFSLTTNTNQTRVNQLEEDFRQSQATEGQLQRLSYEFDNNRKRIRQLFEADSTRLNEFEFPVRASYSLTPPGSGTYIRYVDSVAVRGSQDILIPDRPQSHRITAVTGLNPSFLGPFYNGQEANAPSLIPGAPNNAIPSMIPGQTPQSFLRSRHNPNTYQRGTLAEIPSVISEKNSMMDSSSNQQTHPSGPSNSLGFTSSGVYVNSFRG